MKLLTPAPLTAEAFAPYGDVIQCSAAAERRDINYGHTERFHNLAALDLTADSGVPLLSIFRTRPMALPIPIKVMERHPLSSQAFYPLSNRPYLVVVAARGWLDGYANWLDAASARSLHIVGSGFIPKEGAE